MDVYLALLELLEIRGGMPESGRLSFSLYELLQISSAIHPQFIALCFTVSSWADEAQEELATEARNFAKEYTTDL